MLTIATFPKVAPTTATPRYSRLPWMLAITCISKTNCSSSWYYYRKYMWVLRYNAHKRTGEIERATLFCCRGMGGGGVNTFWRDEGQKKLGNSLVILGKVKWASRNVVQACLIPKKSNNLSDLKAIPWQTLWQDFLNLFKRRWWQSLKRCVYPSFSFSCLVMVIFS